MRQTGNHHRRQPIVEALENRRLMSASLTGAFAGRVPSMLPVAGTSQISVRLTNIGATKTVEPVTVQIFASTTATPSADEILLATQQQNVRLNPRKSVNARLAVPTPTTLPTGNYFLLAEVNGSVVTSRPVEIEAPFSNLAVSFAGLPAKPVAIDGWSAGQRSASVRVINDGNIAISGSVNLSLYLSASNVLDENASLLQTISSAKIALKPGQGKSLRLQIAVPPGTAVGGYFLLAKVTGNGSLVNVTTANNVTTSSRRIAVVSQLPGPSHDRTGILLATGGGGGAIDAGSDCDDSTITDVGTVYGSGESGDSYAYSDAGSGSDGSSSDSSGNNSSGNNSSDNGSANNDSSDDWNSDTDSSGGDF